MIYDIDMDQDKHRETGGYVPGNQGYGARYGIRDTGTGRTQV